MPALPGESAPIAVEGKYGSLIFWQVATEPGGPPAHPGDGTNFPREAAELLGWYEVTFADGLTRAVEIRYGENVRAWNEGFQLHYYAREVRAGTLPDGPSASLGVNKPATRPAGKPLVMWGLEWTNPRPHVEITSVVLHGARALPEIRPRRKVSAARPMLLGITAIELPKWEDYGRGKLSDLPGLGG
jgi:hypothetical protein